MIDALYQLLSKLGFTDPLHAPLTHLPIGLVIGAFLFFLVAIIFGRKNLVPTARHVSILAFLFVFPTILFGVFDWLHFFHGALIAPIKYKMILASAVLVLLAVGIILGSGLKVRTAPMMVIYALAVVSVVGLGWFGGKLVYGGFAPASLEAAQAAAQGATQPDGKSSGGSAATTAGAKLYAESCASCHPNGGNVVAAELPLKTSKKLSSAADFTAFLRAPRMPDGSEGSMPPFPADQVSDKQAADLRTWIVSMIPSWK
jgi:mono/diheme cytochrome c family protein